MFKSNQTGYGVYHGQVESKTKRILAIACLGKKLVFHTEFRIISNNLRLLNFKNWSISSDQGVVQIESNSVWSIPWVSRV